MILNPVEGHGLLTTVLAVIAVFIALKIFTEYKPGVFKRIEKDLDAGDVASGQKQEKHELEDIVAGIIPPRNIFPLADVEVRDIDPHQHSWHPCCVVPLSVQPLCYSCSPSCSVFKLKPLSDVNRCLFLAGSCDAPNLRQMHHSS